MSSRDSTRPSSTRLVDSNVRTRLANLGQDIPTSEQQTPDGLASCQKAEIEKWWPVIKAANIKAE